MPVIHGNPKKGRPQAKCYNCKQMVNVVSSDDPDDDAVGFGEDPDADDADHDFDAADCYAEHMDTTGNRCDGSGKPCRYDNADRVGRFERFDRSTLKAPVRMDNGFLKVEGRIARTGVQMYRDDKGGLRRELRLPEEVFDQASLASFHMVPVTNQHPPGMLTSQNAKKYQVGSVGEDVRRDGEWVVAPLMITDADAINAAEQGRVQLSNGYSCRLDGPDPSLFAQWGEHDAIQREIRGNHCAMVDMARAGSEARMRLDGGDCEAVEADPVLRSENPRVSVGSIQERSQMAHKLTMDGMEFEVNDKNAQAVYDRSQADLKARLDAALKEVADSKKAMTEVQGKFDALDAVHKAEQAATFKMDGKDVLLADMRDDAKRAALIKGAIETGVKARASLLVEAQRFLGANEKLDGKSDTEIKQAVLGKLVPTLKFDGIAPEALDGHVSASYSTVLAMQPKTTPIAAARAAVVAVADAAPQERLDDPLAPSEDPSKARQNMINRMLEDNKPAHLKRNRS